MDTQRQQLTYLGHPYQVEKYVAVLWLYEQPLSIPPDRYSAENGFAGIVEAD